MEEPGDEDGYQNLACSRSAVMWLNKVEYKNAESYFA